MNTPADMLTPPPSVRAGAAPSRAPGVLAARLGALCDPEWSLFLTVLLVPAALGDGRRATFFLGAAAYVAVLKWLGWAVLGRLSPARPRFLLFPAELFAGLAVACAWFYLRNLVALIWPTSYSLRELAWLLPVLLVLHATGLALRAPALLAAARAAPRAALAALGERLALYVPFAAVLTAALWSISTALGVQGTDPMLYTFAARVYLAQGVQFAVPPTGDVILYPSGFGAMNAVAAALAPLTVVQAFHLQHVLLWVTALFLVTTTVAALAGRPLPLLHSLPAPFLFLFPLYALYPDVFYPGTPKQAGAPLCAAVCLLPLLVPVGRASSLLTGGVIALLAVLAAALNPACAPYALAAAVVAGTVFVARAGGRPRGRATVAWVSLVLLGIGLVLPCDTYYRAWLPGHTPQAEAPAAAAPAPAPAEPATAAPRFSAANGASALAAVNPLALSPPESTTDLVWSIKDHLKGWNERLPATALAPAALVLALLALAGLLVPASRATAARDPLVRLVLACVVLWLVLKYAVTFCAVGLSRADYLMALLSVYTRYVLTRCEFLLLFTCLVAAGARLWLGFVVSRNDKSRAAALVAAVAACWLLPALGVWAGVELTGMPVVPAHDRFPVTEDDLRIAAWLDENVPPEKGAVGLAAWTFTAGPHEAEHHIYPLGGGHALPLYGRHYNFRFFLPVLERDGGAAYEKHVRDRFDAVWCRENGIRYFYATPEGLAKNPGLAAAVKDGRLREVRREGESCVYAVEPGEGS